MINPGGNRRLHEKVKTAKGRKISSTRWLSRQINDPYVKLAREEGYRSRAAYKLAEIDEKFKIFSDQTKTVDLGCTPGGWSQVAVSKVGAGNVVSVDLNEMQEIEGVKFIQSDFMDENTEKAIFESIGFNKGVDVVLSDMAAPSCGHHKTDNLRVVALCEMAFDFAMKYLVPGGSFICKILRGGAERELLAEVKKNFRSVKHFKPSSSRSDSSEIYLVALDFKS